MVDATTAIEIGAVLGLGLLYVLFYNRLIALGRRCDQSFADIDVQLKQRHDLIPNLVETVRGYASHERQTLEAVMKARAAAVSAPTPAAQMQAESGLSAALSRLMAVVEAYPQLQANERFAALHEELADIENKIAAARRFLNGAVSEYNTTREQFPANYVAWIGGIHEKQFYDLGTERAVANQAPAVKF